MTGKRERYSADFKVKVALEALKGELTLSQLATKHGVHQTMIAAWRKQAIEGLPGAFPARPKLRTARAPATWRSFTPRSASWWWNGIF